MEVFSPVNKDLVPFDILAAINSKDKLIKSQYYGKSWEEHIMDRFDFKILKNKRLKNTEKS